MALTVDLLIVAALVISAVVTVMVARVLWAVIALAVTSVVVTIQMFRFDAPIAGVFELSVCAGLIPAIFISAISLTRRLSSEDLTQRRRDKLRRFWLLPVLLIIVGALLSQVHLPLDFPPSVPGETDVRNVLWNLRHVDLVGQVVALVGGVFAVVLLLKERQHAD